LQDSELLALPAEAREGGLLVTGYWLLVTGRYLLGGSLIK